jgi:hypothetical protein
MSLLLRPPVSVAMLLLGMRTMAYFGADITYTSNSLYTYTVTVTIHSTDFNDLPEIQIDFGDDAQSLIPRSGVQDLFWPCGATRLSTYVTQHTYADEGVYSLSVTTQPRHPDVLNLPVPPAQLFCAQAMLVIDPSLGPNSSPQFQTPLTSTEHIGIVLHHDPGVAESDGDSVSFTFATPLGEGAVPTVGFLGFDLPTFPPTLVTLDQGTGAFAWDHPHTAGRYSCLLRAEDWRNGQLMGYASRELMLCVTPDYFTNVAEVGAASSITLQPNPGTTFQLSGIGYLPVLLRVLDAQGRTVRPDITATEHSPVNLGELHPGTYVVELLLAEGRRVVLRWVQE